MGPPGRAACRARRDLAPGRLDYSPIWFREVRACGVYAHGMETFRGRNVATMTLTMELLAGEAPLGVNLVTHRMPLADFARAMRIASDKRKSQAVRVAVIP